MKQVFLLTGKPGSGKTSLIKHLLEQTNIKAGGFYTEEIRQGGIRQGFRLVTLEGQVAILAHVGIKSPYRISKYGVDVEALETVGVSALERAAQESDLVVVDEIGKMELFSAKFRSEVLSMIDGDKRVLGTIMLSQDTFADSIKNKPQVKVLSLTRENRTGVTEELLSWLNAR